MEDGFSDRGEASPAHPAKPGLPACFAKRPRHGAWPWLLAADAMLL